ncbi:MAG: right-handed parallel beta-helix repeat-containing protein [Methylicorpusculum sp.]|uniref:right-handed parallel beta-helix repeat-containing protein n=1 Tax=Methylicorpusculum sp. TaxID=2713644 RepID=UPI002717D269|nr:right-handed parallel beta-helix repeat-containing protein [Methylicorpusculum sp.]MDO8941489.1 right-handed parallel beta-helix repeat-containing protein [Methylicorpusculum sp.]
MTIFFIDPSAPTNGNGSRSSPFNTAPYADYNGGWVGHTFLLKAGAVFNARVQLSGANNTTFGAYGKGPKPIWLNGGQDRCLNLGGSTGMQLNHVDFRMSNGVARAVTSSTLTQAVDRSLTVRGCSFSADDVNLVSGVDRIPLFVSGANIKVLGSHFYNCPSDGAHVAAGDNLEFAYNKVSAGNGVHANADGLQLESGSTFNVHHNQVEINGGIKQGFIFNNANGTNVNGTVEYNNITINSESTGSAINVTSPGAVIRRNVIRAKRAGIVCNRNATVESNLIFVDFDMKENYLAAIAFNSSTITHPVARNNTLIGTNKGRGITYSTTSGMTNGVFERNIMQGFAEAMYLGMSSGYVQANNWFWNNAVNSNRSLAASDRLDDADFDSDYIPQNPLAYRANGAVYSDPVVLDMFGRPFLTSTVGSIQPDIIDFDAEMMPIYRASHDNV